MRIIANASRIQSRGIQFNTMTLVTSYFPLNTILAIVCNCMFEVPS
jgi:hypothetical protein